MTNNKDIEPDGDSECLRDCDHEQNTRDPSMIETPLKLLSQDSAFTDNNGLSTDSHAVEDINDRKGGKVDTEAGEGNGEVKNDQRVDGAIHDNTEGSIEIEDDQDSPGEDQLDEEKPCHSGCLHGRAERTRDKYMECCFCTKLFHIDCVGISPMDSKKIKFWPCPDCRKISKNILQLQKSVASLQSLINGLCASVLELSTKCNTNGAADQTHSIELLAAKVVECEKLKAANERLQDKVRLSDFYDTENSSDYGLEDELDENKGQEVRQARGHLLIGDSLIRNVDPSSDDMKVLCMSGAKYPDITKKLRQTKEYFQSITIVCGTNDIATKKDIEKITENLQTLFKVARSKSESIFISSIPPRLDEKVTQQKLDKMNERISVLSEVESGVNFVNHDQNFRFLNEIPDEQLLLSDGVHLSAAGVTRMLQNLKLQKSTKCNIKSNNKSDSDKSSKSPQIITEKRKRTHTKSGNGVTLFYGRESIFSNLHTETPICIDGKTFICNEQYYTYQMARYFDDSEAAKMSMEIEDPYELVALHKKINVNSDAWQSEAERTLYLANMAKYSQNSSARKALLGTGNDVIGEASYNRTWGIGSSIHDPNSMKLNWLGRNKMGQILMNIRDVLTERRSDRRYHDDDRSVIRTSSRQTAQHKKSCWFCGETNHISKNCKHGQAIQCSYCMSLGHKAKFCNTH